MSEKDFKMSDIKKGFVYQNKKSAPRKVISTFTSNKIQYCVTVHNNRYPNHYDLVYEVIKKAYIFVDIQDLKAKILKFADK